MNKCERMHAVKRNVLLAALLVAAAAIEAHAEGPGDQVVVIYNTRVAESKGIAEHYAELRHVPTNQIIAVDLPDNETMTRADFREGLQKPLKKALESQKLMEFGPGTVTLPNGRSQKVAQKVLSSKIRYVVLCYGVPMRVGEDANIHEEGTDSMPAEARRNEAATDSELACFPIPSELMRYNGPLRNALYGVTNANVIDPTNGLLIAARLDGPTPAIARALVDKAIEGEKDGLWGRAYFDLRGLTNGEYKVGDDWIRGAAEVCKRTGCETVIDYSPGTFPASFPMSQIAFYAGWYDAEVSGPFTRPTVEFMPGAIAYHLHSFSATILHGNTTRQWVGPLLAKGVTATMGCVSEPFLTGTPNVAILFHHLTYGGFTFGEAAYAAQEYVSWQVIVVGDPLYRPFAKTPQQQHEDLERKKSKLIEWSYLRLINVKLLTGASTAEVIKILESFDTTRQSAVLTEKLADLYAAESKKADSVANLQKSLKLDPSPQQRVRIMLSLAGQLASLGRDAEAYAVYQDFLTSCADYPDQVVIYRRLLDLAQKLGKKEDAEKYQREINRLSTPPK